MERPAADKAAKSSSAELLVGQEVEAWLGGQLLHRGHVVDTLQSRNLLWITVSSTGMRRLLDKEEFRIKRITDTGPR